jgi:hypothetical protein
MILNTHYVSEDIVIQMKRLGYKIEMSYEDEIFHDGQKEFLKCTILEALDWFEKNGIVITVEYIKERAVWKYYINTLKNDIDIPFNDDWNDYNSRYDALNKAFEVTIPLLQ